MTPNGERQKDGPVRSWRRVKILTPRHLCENPKLPISRSEKVHLKQSGVPWVGSFYFPG